MVQRFALRESLIRAFGSAGLSLFSGEDLTAGVENELQGAVEGDRSDVDLPRTIEASRYYANVLRRVGRGESPSRGRREVERFLENGDRVWESSWVRFPRAALHPAAEAVFAEDLRADKGDPASGPRSDAARMAFEQAGERWVRVPLSYLLKLALADAVGRSGPHPPAIAGAARRAMACYLSDNTSPEVVSFHPVAGAPGRAVGPGIANETARRFLLTQLLAQYAGEAFGLEALGQRPLFWFSPHPPLRIRQLNEGISDAFFRELFLSPCLSGWDRGEEKHAYMRLCHEVLSRSALQAVAKLREAGILANDLVVLPALSSVSLMNNGTHVSLGSRALSGALRRGTLGAREEKWIGDLVIKAVEHFLPLFVGTYSAAPCRVAFPDFHPERMLGFLPHQLDYTHLRMLWRRWRGKAATRFLGRALTPFGPRWLDRTLEGVLSLRGDYLTDVRLLDFLVALQSTPRSPGFDGTPGNHDRLKADLADLGEFDPRLAFYAICRQRSLARAGFSGFEGRHYSLFPSLAEDLAAAVTMQSLVTAAVLRWIAAGTLTHADVPDDPVVESERRQFFFAAAAGVPTLYVRRGTPNRLLSRILAGAARTRPSRRYSGHVRVELSDYRRAALRLLERGAAGIEGAREAIEDLRRRLSDPRAGAASRLEAEIAGGAKDPLRIPAEAFNRDAERFFRGPLRLRHAAEGWALLESDAARSDREGEGAAAGVADPAGFVRASRAAVLSGTAAPETLRRLILLQLAGVARAGAEWEEAEGRAESGRDAPVRRTG